VRQGVRPRAGSVQPRPPGRYRQIEPAFAAFQACRPTPQHQPLLRRLPRQRAGAAGQGGMDAVEQDEIHRAGPGPDRCRRWPCSSPNMTVAGARRAGGLADAAGGGGDLRRRARRPVPPPRRRPQAARRTAPDPLLAAAPAASAPRWMPPRRASRSRPNERPVACRTVRLRLTTCARATASARLGRGAEGRQPDGGGGRDGGADRALGQRQEHAAQPLPA
jgi:hypothetical protein